MSNNKINNELAESKQLNEKMFDQISRLNNELVNLQRELAIKNARLAELNEQKNQFLGIATHELRNPLAAIISGCRLIEHKEKTEKNIKDTIQEIHRKSYFMLHLVDNLLNVSRIESGKLVLDKTSTGIAEMLEQLVKRLQLDAKSKNIKLKLVQSSVLPCLDIDVYMIEQVLTNLISNAIKFSPKGSEARIVASIENGELLISVEDQGPGIPEEEMSQLFKPFTRTSIRPTNGEPSTGLGLSIAKKMIEAHQGRIWMENLPGIGSRCIIALPV
jgi:signal transduction histidine kinase